MGSFAVFMLFISAASGFMGLMYWLENAKVYDANIKTVTVVLQVEKRDTAFVEGYSACHAEANASSLNHFCRLNPDHVPLSYPDRCLVSGVCRSFIIHTDETFPHWPQTVLYRGCSGDYRMAQCTELLEASACNFTDMYVGALSAVAGYAYVCPWNVAASVLATCRRQCFDLDYHRLQCQHQDMDLSCHVNKILRFEVSGGYIVGNRSFVYDHKRVECEQANPECTTAYASRAYVPLSFYYEKDNPNNVRTDMPDQTASLCAMIIGCSICFVIVTLYLCGWRQECIKRQNETNVPTNDDNGNGARHDDDNDGWDDSISTVVSNRQALQQQYRNVPAGLQPATHFNAY